MTMKHSEFRIKVETEMSDGSMIFKAYGNTKNHKDHAKDVTVDGAYIGSIERHKRAGTMPKFLWSHDKTQMPLGVITSWREDDHGLYFEGKFASTQAGLDAYQLAKMGALDSFSIGYLVQKERFEPETDTNYLEEIDVKEISLVNFAANEQSLMQEVKARMEEGELPTKRVVQRLLQEAGLSRRKAERTMNQFVMKEELTEVFEIMCLIKQHDVEEVKAIIKMADEYLNELVPKKLDVKDLTKYSLFN